MKIRYGTYTASCIFFASVFFLHQRNSADRYGSILVSEIKYASQKTGTPSDRRSSQHLLIQFFPKSKQAINNGEKLIQFLSSGNEKLQSQHSGAWIGKTVAFDCVFPLSKMTIAATIHNNNPIKVKVRFRPKQSSLHPLPIESCILGTVKSIDVKKKIIYIEASEENWQIISIG